MDSGYKYVEVRDVLEAEDLSCFGDILREQDGSLPSAAWTYEAMGRSQDTLKLEEREAKTRHRLFAFYLYDYNERPFIDL
jgi:hypothetical protein